MTMGKYKTDFLFQKNNALVGAASAFNLAGNFFDYNTSGTENEADMKAIENDWGVVGQDLTKVISSYEPK